MCVSVYMCTQLVITIATKVFLGKLPATRGVWNFKTCDELSQEISGLKGERREYTVELAALQKKATKLSWYFKNKESQPSKETQATLLVSSNADEQLESNTVSIEQEADTVHNQSSGRRWSKFGSVW